MRAGLGAEERLRVGVCGRCALALIRYAHQTDGAGVLYTLLYYTVLYPTIV